MISILYVDDEADLLDLGKIFLEESGEIRVDTTISAQQALHLLIKNHYDAVVSDFQMPDMDGIEFLKHIRAHTPDLPVILFTGKGKEEVVIAALNNGADYYLQKGGEPEVQFADLRTKVLLAVERQKSAEKVLFFNRLYAIMSGINAAILRIHTRDELFHEVSRIMMEEGRFVRVWIGLLNVGRNGLVPAASAGFFEACTAPVTVTGTVTGNGQDLSGRAAYERKSQVSEENFISSIPAGPAPLPADYGSTAAFPIWFHNEVLGTFQIYAREASFFGRDEVRLLEEVSSDISFALEHIEAEEERRRTQLALMESEEKFRILVEESLVGVYIIQGSRIIHANPKFAAMMGYSQAEMVEERTVEDLVAPESRDLVATSIQRRLSGESKSQHYAFKGLRKDGELIDLEAAGTRVIYQGKPIIIGTIIDITERMRAEQERAEKLEELSIANKKIRAAEERLWAHIAALTESQERFNDSERRMTDIINFLPDATFAIDLEGRVLAWNRAIEKMTGIAADDIVGKDDFEYALPFYKERRPVLANLVISFDEDLARKYDYLHKEGEKYTAQIFLPHLRGGKGAYAWFVAAPLYDNEGNMTGAIETIRDISDFEEVRQALRASRERYRNIIENTRDGVIVARDGVIVFSNPAIRTTLGGYTAEDIQGMPLKDFIHAKDRERILKRIATRLSGAHHHDTARLRVFGKKGEIHCLESRALLIDWEGSPATLSFLSEVPDRAPATEVTGQPE
jgi:PAS domain S-box-containing protein